MNDRPPDSVVEAKAQGDQKAEAGQHELSLRICQQEILAKLGVLALQGTPFPALAEQTVKLVAEGLEVEFCKIMEYIAAENAFVVRAGFGWDPKIIGVAKVGADLRSPAGYAFRTAKPVISNQLEHEDRFRTPDLLLEYGIHRAMNVIVQGSSSAYGVLECDSRSPQEFGEDDIPFLQGAANVLGMAMERQRMEHDLRSALDTHKTLLKELNHRVKNSLQLVASMLQLQAGLAGPRHELMDASNRVSAIARAHEHLYRGTDISRIDLGQYLSDLCANIERSVPPPCSIDVVVAKGALVQPDRAIPIALIINELVTNAVKYAYPNKQPNCPIWVHLDRGDTSLAISVRDAGVGLPDGFDPATTKGLGMRIVTALAKQIGADLTTRRANPGAEFVLRLVP